MREIVYVREGDEQPFIDAAIALQYTELIFIYHRKTQKKPVSDKIIIKSALIEKKGNDEYISLGTSLSSISKNTTMLVNNEFDAEKDFVHQRRSGLNHVWVKECKKKNIVILFNLSELRKHPVQQMSTIIGRMKQNAKLCKKYGVEFSLVSFGENVSDLRDAKDVAAMKRAIFS